MYFLTDMLILISFLIVSFGIGRKALGFFELNFKGLGEEFVLSEAVGFAINSFLVWILGFFGLLYGWLIWIFIIICLFISLKDIVNFMKRLFGKRNFSLRLKEILLLAFLPLGIMAFLAARSPLFGTDALAYHLFCPKIFVEYHKIFPIPYSPNALQPFFTEMLYTLLIAVEKIELSNFIQVIFLLLSTIGVYEFAKIIFENRNYALIAALVFFTIPGVIVNATYSYVDVVLTFYSLITAYTLLKFWKERDLKFFILSACFLGVVTSIKYLGIFVFLVYFVFCIYMVFSKQRILKFRYLAIAAAIVGIFALPYYLRSFIVLKNPFFPYFNKLFAGWDWSSDAWKSVGKGFDPKAFLMAPINITFLFRHFGGGAEQFGPIFIAFLPAIFLKKMSSFVKALVSIVLIFFCLWFFNVQHLRFLLPISPFVAILTVVGLRNLRMLCNRKILKIFVIGIFAFLLMENIIVSSYFLIKRTSIYFGKDTMAVLEKEIPSFSLARWVNENLPKESKILIADETRILYFEPEVIREGNFRRFKRINSFEELGDIAGILKKEGFSHVVAKSINGNIYFNKVLQKIEPDIKLVYTIEWSGREEKLIYYIYKIS